ncbi:hypothetical protein BHE74_00059002, partial [Ensete ventricosum]
IHTEASTKQPVGSPIADQATVGRPNKWVKIAVRKHKSHCGEASSRRTAQERELEILEEDSSPTYRRPKSMRDLCVMQVREDDEGYYVLQMADWALKDSKLEKLKSERDPEQLVRARQRVDELEADNAKLRSGLDELSGRLEEVDKELNKLWEGLAESQC